MVILRVAGAVGEAKDIWGVPQADSGGRWLGASAGRIVTKISVAQQIARDVAQQCFSFVTTGGSVYFDDLGQPWPKHECFDEDRYASEFRNILSNHVSEGAVQVIGVIIETETYPGRERGHIVVRCSDGVLIDQQTDTTENLSILLGQMVLVDKSEAGNFLLWFVNFTKPRLIAYLQLIDNDPYHVQEEYAYSRKAEAEEWLRLLDEEFPGRYRLQTTKRTEYSDWIRLLPPHPRER